MRTAGLVALGAAFILFWATLLAAEVSAAAVDGQPADKLPAVVSTEANGALAIHDRALNDGALKPAPSAHSWQFVASALRWRLFIAAFLGAAGAAWAVRKRRWHR